jgi:hypothetical protein
MSEHGHDEAESLKLGLMLFLLFLVLFGLTFIVGFIYLAVF